MLKACDLPLNGDCQTGLGNECSSPFCAHRPNRLHQSRRTAYRWTDRALRKAPIELSAKDVPRELADVIDRLLEKRPGRRFATAEDVRLRLASLLSQVQQHGLHRRPFAIRRKILAAGAFVLAFAAAGWLWTVEPRPTAEKLALSPPTSAKTTADAESVASGEASYFTTIDATRRSLIDARRNSFYARTGDQEWRTEIESLKRALDKIEFDSP